MEYEIIEIYKETASGGSMKGRPQLQRLFLSVERDEIDVIVFTKLDRFTRSISDFFIKYNDLEENDVEIVAIDQPEISTDSALGRVMRNMLLAFAEFEREMIRIRTTEGMRAILERGGWRGGQRRGREGRYDPGMPLARRHRRHENQRARRRRGVRAALAGDPRGRSG